MNSGDRQRAYYEAHAGRFDRRQCLGLLRRANRNHEAKVQRIIAALAPRPGMRVLEVGVGTGLHAGAVLRRESVQLTGVDLARAMVRLALRRCPALGGVAAQGEVLPFAPDRFDAVYCSGSLHHFPDPSAGLTEMARVLRRGGTLAIMEPNWISPVNLPYAAFDPLEHYMVRLNRFRLRRWLRGLGFAGILVEPFLFTPPFPGSWSRCYDRLDRLAARAPLLSAFSIMIFATGRKE